MSDIVKFTRDSSYQKIKAWYLDDASVELTIKDKQLRDRMRHIWGLRMRDKYSREQAIKVAKEEYGISQATAYRYYNQAQQLFGEIDAVDVRAEKLMHSEALWEIYQDCMTAKKYKEAIAALKERAKLFDFEDNGEKIDPKKLEASQYIMNFPRGTSKLLEKILTGGVADFNQITAEDVDFQEVKENEKEEGDE